MTSPSVSLDFLINTMVIKYIYYLAESRKSLRDLATFCLQLGLLVEADAGDDRPFAVDLEDSGCAEHATMLLDVASKLA